MRSLSLLVLAVATFAATSDAARVVCYYGSWAVYRQGAGHFDAENIDGSVCTHLVYAFAKLSYEGQLQVYDDYNDVGDEWHIGQFTKLQALKLLYPNLKLMIAVGGWNHGPGTFQETVKNPAKRQTWVDTSVDFMRKYGFEGLDIDWEYQDSVGGTPEDLAGFNEVLRMFRQRFDQEGFILSAATSANMHLMEVNYDWRVMSETLDFINLMAYDLHGAWETHTGHQSALRAIDSEEGNDRNLNVETIVKRNIELGADPAKINIGIPTYGRGFTLADASNNGLYAPTTGPSAMGENVPEAGILAYAEICRTPGWNIVNSPQGPYAVKGDQWVGYETVESIRQKKDFLRGLGVNNYMIWSVETDDFVGNCGEKYALLKAIYE